MGVIEPVAELADGGYWYVLNAETVDGETQPAGLPDTHHGWTATYIGDGTVVIRSPKPLTGVDAVSVSSAQKLTAAGEAARPYGRIEGR